MYGGSNFILSLGLQRGGKCGVLYSGLQEVVHGRSNFIIIRFTEGREVWSTLPWITRSGGMVEVTLLLTEQEGGKCGGLLYSGLQEVVYGRSNFIINLTGGPKVLRTTLPITNGESNLIIVSFTEG